MSVSLTDVSYAYPVPDLDGSPFDDGPTPDREAVDQLRDITMTIRPGTLTLLIGGSGSGKSTLLRTMNGLVPKFFEGTMRGKAEVDGTDLAGVELHDVGRTSAMIFQNPRTQFFTSSVRTELAFGLENYGVDPSEIRDAMTRAVGQTGIAHLLDRRLDTLSGGELQRVACACALVTDVDLLLFDEPTSNLSAEGIDDFRHLVAQLKASGKALVIAEHRLHLFRGMVDVVHRISDGRVAETMTGDDLFSLTDMERTERGLRAVDVVPVDIPELPTAAASSNTDGPKLPTGLMVEHLSFSYGHGPTILDVGSLFLPAGAVTILTGPNGAGKSTLARLICGLEKSPPSARIGMGEPWSTGRRQKSCGMVMQDVRRQLFSESVEREVTLGLDPRQRDAANVPALLERLDLVGQRDRHPLSLSGGQAQRLVVAATIAQDKEVVIFDEPTSGVDFRHLTSIADLVGDLATAGKVVIVITHDPELMARCGDYLINITTLKGQS